MVSSGFGTTHTTGQAGNNLLYHRVTRYPTGHPRTMIPVNYRPPSRSILSFEIAAEAWPTD